MAFGEPCTHCGDCCKAEQCGVSVEIFGASAGRCSALLEEDGKFFCGLVRCPEKYDAIDPNLIELLGIGRGCLNTRGEEVKRSGCCNEKS